MVTRRFIGFVFNLATPLVVFAANPVAWNVNISTTGDDVFWTSPTAITTGLAAYDYSYEITKLTANVALFGDRDLLSMLDETSGSGTTTSIPFELLQTMLDEPTSGSSADIRISVDAAGFGHASGTNIELGSFFGFPIRRVDMMATVSIIGNSAGDYNRDGAVDASDYAIWRRNFGATVDLAADGNRNNVVDAADYVIWRDNIGAGTAAGLNSAGTVPEPSTCLALTAVVSALLFAARLPAFR